MKKVPRFGIAESHFPPRGKIGSVRNIKRVMAHILNMHNLGEKYRRETPVAKRSYLAWLRFLKRNAPGYIGSPRRVQSTKDARRQARFYRASLPHAQEV